MFAKRRTGSAGLSVAVVGAGFAGIAAAVKLKQVGFDDFTVFERSAGAGGTWFDNTYPGCGVDTLNDLYSFSFLRYDWTRTYAQRAEMQQYAEDTIDRFGLRKHFRFETGIEQIVWDDAAREYDVALSSGEQLRFGSVISAVGFLNVPFYPEWAASAEFTGRVLHTWRWPADADLTGLRVAIVGTGSSSAQITPALAEVAAHVDLYQRSPTWVFPKDDRPLTPAERRRQMHPIAHRVQRYRLYRTGVRRAIGMFRTGSKIHQEMSSVCTHHLNKQITDPELRALLTPDYPLGCKRPTISSRYYPALARPNVRLIPRAVRMLTANGVVDDEGHERPVDVVVLATGFQPQRFLANLEVRGVGGRRLHDVWGDEPKAIVGSGVPGFPNFFMLYGPNTNGGVTAVYNIECSADVAVRALKRMRRRGARVVDWRPRALDLYTAWLDRHINRELTAQALTDDCTNYYHGASGRNVTQWPGSHRRFKTVSRLVPALALRSYK